MKTVAYTGTAAKQLRKLPTDAREQVIGKIHRYAETGAGDVKKLKGMPGARLRIGNFRAIFTETAGTVLEVGDRKDIYE